MKLRLVMRKAIPFVAAFALGVLAASLFVDVIPGFSFGMTGRHRRCEENYRIRVERIERETLAPPTVIENENLIYSKNPPVDVSKRPTPKAPVAETSNR
jgi:hypothetical protein